MKQKISIIAVVLILFGTSAWWFYGQYQNKNSDSKSRVVNSNKKVSQYTCPMHPHIMSDKPGRCPICGMDLVPVDDDDDHKGHDHTKHSSSSNKELVIKNETLTKNEITKKNKANHKTTKAHGEENETLKAHVDIKLSLRKQQMIGVEIDKAQKKKLFKSIRAPGRIAFDPELYTTQSEYLEALKQMRRVKKSPIKAVQENTRQMINSAKIRLQVLGLSNSQIEELAKKGTQTEGLLVSGKGQNNWIYADVYEVDLPFITKGLSVQITANFLQGKTLPGKVISVDQVINPNTRTAKVRIQLLKSDSSIRPESYVNVNIFAPVGEHISVPIEAVMDTGRESFVFVRRGEGKFEPIKVNVILETDNEAALLGKIVPGDEIVVGGNFMLDSESRLKSVIRKGALSGGHHH